MAETSSDVGLRSRSESELREPAERGRLSIADRVVEQVAVLAARQVEGVAVLGSALERAVGRNFPRAQAHVAGRRVRLVMQVAVLWPSALPEVSAQVRESVRDKVSALVGMHVDAVDVSVAKVVHAQPHQTRRVQ